MQFYLTTLITPNKDINNKILENLNEVIKNSEKLKKGIDGAFEINLSKFDEKIKLEIKSEYRAHNIFLRIKKILAEYLGKNYKIGIKEISVKSYEIHFEIEKKPLKEIKVPFATVSFFENTAKILCENLDEKFLNENYADRIIKLVKDKIAKQYYEGKKEFWKLIWKSEEKEISYKGDPSEEMKKRNWIIQISKGKWFYGPQATMLLNVMESIAVEEFVNKIGFMEVINSNIKPLEIWLKTGHLSGMPNEIYYVANPKTRDEIFWEEFKDLIKITREIPKEKLKDLVEVNYGITYAQCPMIYYSLTNKTIPDENLPLKFFERTVNSARYESGGTHGIERCDEFHRIECVYIGSPEQLINLKKEMIERYKYIFNEILDLEWRLAQVTPFYMQQAEEIFNDENENLGTIDFEGYLPYRGNRNSEWLEFQNLSIVGKKYIDAFNIKAQKANLWSGCTGIGLERWLVVFLAQHGFDYEKWPEKFLKYVDIEKLKEVEKKMKFL